MVFFHLKGYLTDVICGENAGEDILSEDFETWFAVSLNLPPPPPTYPVS